jgi:hypothetical protein
MPLHVGARVVATRSLGAGRIPAGSVGRIVNVGFFGGYDVSFGRGRLLRDLSRDSLRLPDGGSWLRPAGAGGVNVDGQHLAAARGDHLRAGHALPAGGDHE